MLRVGLAIAGGCLAMLALSASPAFATSDRLDYADQVNPICKSSNQQTDDLIQATEAEIDRLYGLHPKSRKKASAATAASSSDFVNPRRPGETRPPWPPGWRAGSEVSTSSNAPCARLRTAKLPAT